MELWFTSASDCELVLQQQSSGPVPVPKAPPGSCMSDEII